MTAFDPGGERLSVKTNRERQEALEDDLGKLSLKRWPTVGWDAQSGHREEGVAVAALLEGEAISLGARYGQEAIFAWTPTAWVTLSCTDERRREAGWTLQSLCREERRW